MIGDGPERARLDALESFAALTYTASHTSRIRFGPLVLSMTFRHPAITARITSSASDALVIRQRLMPGTAPAHGKD